MKVNFTESALSDDQFSSMNTARVNEPAPRGEDMQFSGGEVFMAGQFKYNPVVAGIHKAFNWLRSEEEDIPGWSVYDNPELLVGYPSSLGVGVSSPEEWARVTQEYERDLYFDRVLAESGGAGVASSVAAGFMNPMYMVPYIRVGQQFRWGKAVADATIGEVLTEITYQGAELDRTRTLGESIFNIAAGGLMGGVVGGVMARNAFTPDELTKIQANLKKEVEFVGSPKPEDAPAATMFEPNSLFPRLAEELDVEINTYPVVTSREGTPIVGQTDRAKGPRALKLTEDVELWEQTFYKKVWTKPRTLSDGTSVDPLPAGAFKSPEEWAEFVVRHERAHFDNPRMEGETRGAYDTRINNIALEEMVAQSRMGKEELVKNLGDIGEIARIKGWMNRAAAGLTPLRTLASPNANTRALASLLGEQNVVGTQRAAIETLVKKYDTYLGSALIELNGTYKAFRTRGEKMGYNSYKAEVVRALRNGDTHKIPEVQQAAQKIRREILDPIRKRATEVGIYSGEGNVARFSESYFPRVYNFEYITHHLSEFKDDIARWIMKENPDATETMARDAAGEVASKIRHQYDGVITASEGQEFVASSLKGRKIAIPDNALEKWLVNDPEYVLRAWSHNLATQIEFHRMFGGTDLSKHLADVEAEWEEKIDLASRQGAPIAAKLERQKNRDLQDLKALRDRLLNRYKLPDNPTSGWVRAGRAARNLNVVRLLGGMTLSAIPDMARPLYHHGLIRYGKSMKAMAFSPEFRNMAKADAKRAGVAMEMVLNQRLTAITELDYVPSIGKGGYVDAAEHTLERLVIGRGGAGWDFGRLSLMSPWNSSMKMVTFTTAQDGLIRNLSKNVVNEKKLAQAGINQDMAKRMKDQIAKYGKQDQGLWLSNLDEWDDIAAQELFEATLLREVDATIITPGIMDKPLWMSSEMGKVLGQFKSFAFAATNKQYLSGMNNFDAMFVQGVLAATTLGGMAWALKRQLAGYDDSDITTDEFMMRAIEHSGVIGFGSELINFGTGMANAAGIYKGDGNFRWARQGLTSTLAGPTGGLAADVLRGARAFTRDEPNAGDVEALRRILPYQNLFYTRKAFDAVEQWEKDRRGIYE